GPAVPAVAARAQAGLQGGHHRRRRRRDARRLRHLQRSEGPPILGAPARIEAPPATPAAALSLHARDPVAARRVPEGVLPRAVRGRREPVLLPPAAVGTHLLDQA